MSTSVDLQKPLTILQNSGMLLAKYYMHVYVNPDLFHLAGWGGKKAAQLSLENRIFYMLKLTDSKGSGRASGTLNSTDSAGWVRRPVLMCQYAYFMGQ